MKSLINEILQHEGPATIVTHQVGEPHVTATWNSYIKVNEAGHFLIPVGGFNQTEKNIKAGSNVIMLIGSKSVMGLQSMGAGLRLTGTATFITAGTEFENTKKLFAWVRAVLVFSINEVEQLQ